MFKKTARIKCSRMCTWCISADSNHKVTDYLSPDRAKRIIIAYEFSPGVGDHHKIYHSDDNLCRCKHGSKTLKLEHLFICSSVFFN